MYEFLAQADNGGLDALYEVARKISFHSTSSCCMIVHVTLEARNMDEMSTPSA